MTRVAAMLAMMFIGTAARADSVELQLPLWVQPQWTEFSKSRGLDLSLRVNPFVWQGDFDGDNSLDVAVFVKRKSDGKEGIAVMWRSKGSSPTVLGAGSALGNGGDDFSWVDYWGVEESGSLHESYNHDVIRLETDGLLVIKESSASALIYFENGEPKWQQQGD